MAHPKTACFGAVDSSRFFRRGGALGWLAFQDRYERLAQPFEWKFTRADLASLLERLALKDSGHLRAAA